MARSDVPARFAELLFRFSEVGEHEDFDMSGARIEEEPEEDAESGSDTSN